MTSDLSHRSCWCTGSNLCSIHSVSLGGSLGESTILAIHCIIQDAALLQKLAKRGHKFEFKTTPELRQRLEKLALLSRKFAEKDELEELDQVRRIMTRNNPPYWHRWYHWSLRLLVS